MFPGRRTPSNDLESWKVAWTWLCLWLSLVLYVAMGRYWVDASIPQLEAIEANFLRQHGQVCLDPACSGSTGTYAEIMLES